MKSQQVNCKKAHCKQRVNVSKLPFVVGLLITLLPKCPFCMLAYSSAIALCSGGKIYMHHPGWTSYISIGLVLLTIVFIASNYRDVRTLFALVFVAVGGMLIGLAELITGELAHFYLGAFMVLFGAWLNASFLYIYHRIKDIWSMIAFTSASNESISPKH